MPTWFYSIRDIDPSKTVKCAKREIRISPKDAREVCNTIKGMKIEDAKKMLEDVIVMKKVIPIKHYKGGVPHKQQDAKFYAGRYPIKATDEILKLLTELEANAEHKGLDIEKLIIIHAATHRGRKIKKYIPRAFGRGSPYFDTLTHVELACHEGK